MESSVSCRADAQRGGGYAGDAVAVLRDPDVLRKNRFFDEAWHVERVEQYPHVQQAMEQDW